MMAKILWDTIFLISGTFSMSLVLNGSLFTFGAGYRNSTITDASIPLQINSTALLNLSTNTSAELSESITSHTTIITTTRTNISPVKKSVAAAVRSHFDDCPDSHRHFCFHGTCRFLILEDTPACVCHQGFVGIRCEHADLLAVVATDHRQLTIAPLLALCVIICVFIAALSPLLLCWSRQRCCRRRHAHHDTSEKPCGVLKHGVSYCPSESVV